MNSATEHSPPAITSTRHRRLVAASVTAFVLALGFYFLTVLCLDPRQTTQANLDPRPDAVEYFALAHSLYHEGTSHIHIGHDALPSRYPDGFPVLMLPWLAVLPSDSEILAPFRTNQTLGLALLVLSFTYLWRRGQKIAAGFVTLLLATLPAFVVLARAPLSEMSGALFVLAAFMFVEHGLARERLAPLYAAAALLGLALNLRLQFIFFAPVLIAFFVLTAHRTLTRRFAHAVAGGILFLLCAAPTLVSNALNFGHPLRTGYHFWVPAVTSPGATFHPRFISENLLMLVQEFTLTSSGFRVAHLFGSGTYFVPSFALLLGVSLFWVRPNRFALCAAFACLTFSAAALTYFFLDLRLYFPLLVLGAFLAARPLEALAAHGANSRQRAVQWLIVVLVAASVIGFPSKSGYTHPHLTTQAWDALASSAKPDAPWNFRLVERFRALGIPKSIVLSDLNPVYLSTLLPETIAAPIDAEHDFSHSRVWRFETRDAIALANEGLRIDRPVFALLIDAPRSTELARRLPAIDGARWERLDRQFDEPGAIYRLVRAEAAP